MIRRRHFALTGLVAACGLSQAAFRDPLDVAAVPVRLADRRSLLSVAVAGTRLVAVGMRGLVIASDDQGASWQQQTCPVSSDLVSVFFLTAQRGWACGHDGVILVTEDAGRRWAPVVKGAAFADIFMKHYEQAEAAGKPNAAALLASIKQSFAAGPEQPVLGIWFDSETTGWAVSTFGMLMGTEDGGKSWLPWMEQIDNPDLLHLYSITGIAGEVYITSERGKVFKLDRARRHFAVHDTGYPGGLFGLVGTADTLIAFGLQGTALRSRDRGLTWQRLTTGLRAGLNAGMVLAGGGLVLASQDGRLLSSSDQGQSFQVSRVPRPGLLTGLALAPDGRLVVVGFNGVQMLKA